MRDENNNLIGFSYKNETYYYKKNIQEDIIGIYNNKYEQIVEYEYDTWGRILSIKDENGQEIANPSHIAHINPFRYRSYYYDEETKLYYLNSRYYNPEWGRFINADSMTKAPGTSVLSTNMYAYCENNPVINSDETGEWFGKAIPVKVSGITSGRNSMSAIYQTKLTKLANGTTKTISLRVVAKSVTANVVSDLPHAIIKRVKNAASELSKYVTPTTPLYWYTP